MTESTGRRRGGFGAFSGRERQGAATRETSARIGVIRPAARAPEPGDEPVSPRSTTRADKTTVLPVADAD